MVLIFQRQQLGPLDVLINTLRQLDTDVVQIEELVIGGVPRRLFVAGVWRDYARQWGAIIVPLADYRGFTGDATATEASFDLAPGADPEEVQAALQAALSDAVRQLKLVPQSRYDDAAAFFG